MEPTHQLSSIANIVNDLGPSRRIIYCPQSTHSVTASKLCRRSKMKDNRLDLNSEPNLNRPAEETPNKQPFLGVRFSCCGVYARIYQNHQKTAYCGNCPKCSRPVRVKIAPHGSDNRFFST